MKTATNVTVLYYLVGTDKIVREDLQKANHAIEAYTPYTRTSVVVVNIAHKVIKISYIDPHP